MDAHPIALDETDSTDPTQLTMYIRCVDDNFEVAEELRGQTTAQDIFCQFCDAVVNVGLPGKRLVGITTDGVPSMTRKRNGLVVLVQRKLEEEGAEEAIVLPRAIHQQGRKCLKFDNAMSVVEKCIKQIRSTG